MFLSEWREFPSAPYLAGGKKNLMTARVSMLLKSRASLTCFRACVIPGRAKHLPAPRLFFSKVYLKCCNLVDTNIAFKYLWNLLLKVQYCVCVCVYHP